MSETLDDGEYRIFKIGTHHVHVANTDGEPELYINDHATIRVEGEHKDEPMVVTGEEEFDTKFVQLAEREYWERYNG